MRRTIFIALAVGLFGANLSAREISMELHAQEQSLWCWAAVTQSVVQHSQGREVPQCRMASRFNHGTPGEYCCSSLHAASTRCNQGTKLYQLLDHYGVLQRHLFSPVTTETLEEEIRSGFPVPVRIEWKSGWAHYILVYGTDQGNVAAWDPSATGGRKVLTRRGIENYNGGKWVETFLTK